MDAMEIGLRHRLRRALRQMEGQHRHLKPIYAELVRAVDGSAASEMREWLSRYREALAAHFALEEEVLFPALRGLHPQRVGDLDRLSDDHQRFQAKLLEIEGALLTACGPDNASRIAAFRDSLEDHERREERLVVQLLDVSSEPAGEERDRGV